MTKHCKGCALHGPQNVPAVGTFKFPDGHIATGCRNHLDQWAVSVPHIFGEHPYKGEVGSKGGGASAEMAAKLSGEVGTIRLKVLSHIVTHGQKGAEDVAASIGIDADIVSPRLSELKEMGLAYKGPRTAKTRMGNSAHVYGATEAGREAVAGQVAA